MPQDRRKSAQPLHDPNANPAESSAPGAPADEEASSRAVPAITSTGTSNEGMNLNFRSR